jgi:hypothetical protein
VGRNEVPTARCYDLVNSSQLPETHIVAALLFIGQNSVCTATHLFSDVCTGKSSLIRWKEKTKKKHYSVLTKEHHYLTSAPHHGTVFFK